MAKFIPFNRDQAELWLNLGDGGNQAAFCDEMSAIATPLEKMTPSMMRGN